MCRFKFLYTLRRVLQKMRQLPIHTQHHPIKTENTQLPLGPSRDEDLDAWESTLMLEPEHSQNHRTSSKTSMNFVVLMLTLPAFDANNLKLFLLLLCPPGEYPRHCVRCACCVHCASCCVQSGPTFHDRRISKKSPRYPELHLMMDFFS